MQPAGDFVLFPMMSKCDEESFLALKNGINIEATFVDLSSPHLQHEYGKIKIIAV